MTNPKDRRRHARKVGQGLIVLIGGKVYPVVDISTVGLSFQATGYRGGDSIVLKLAQLTNISDCIEARITVTSSDNTVTRGEFKPTVPLLRYIISHIGEATGAEPAYFG